MSTTVDPAQMARDARRASESGWFDGLTRLGFVARGVVYVVVAILAVQVARGERAEPADKQGALAAIAERSFGSLLLVVLAVGLAFYALWRFSEAAWGKRDETNEAKRTGKRLLSFGKGALYAALCASTVSVLLGSSGGAGQEDAQTWTARVLDLPAGRLIVGGIGVAVVVVGGCLAYWGLSQRFEEKLDTSRMSELTHRAAELLGTYGEAARGVVVALAGALLIKAAADYDPTEAAGIDGTLRTIAAQAYGRVLLFVAAVGLAAFGAYSFIEARHRRL